MKHLFRITSIIMIMSIARLLISCFPCHCSDEVHPFDLKHIDIDNLDNTGNYTKTIQTDTLKRTAVAFQVSVYGKNPLLENENTYDVLSLNLCSMGIKKANATSCDCPYYFKPNQKIEDIKVYTLLPINDSIPENSDVTNLFVAYSNTDNWNRELYMTPHQLLETINPDIISNYADIGFKLFFKETIKDNQAQFFMKIKLSDGRELSQTSYLITLED